MIAVSYLMKKIKKIFIEVISNTKILLNEVASGHDFEKFTGDLTNGRLDKGGTEKKSNMVIKLM